MNNLPPLSARLRANAALGLPLSPARQLVLADHLDAIAADQVLREMPEYVRPVGWRVVQWGERVFVRVEG